MDIGTIIDWVGRGFGIAFLIFILLVLFVPSWHAPQREYRAPISRLDPGIHHDGDTHDAA